MFPRPFLFSLIFLTFIFSAVSARAELNTSALQVALKSCIASDHYDSACLKNNTDPLEDFITQVSSLEKTEYQTFNREEKIAFWVNAYTVWLLRVLSDLPEGRKDLPEFSEPFSQHQLFILGEAYSLQAMQKKIWNEFRDERIFFCLASGTLTGPSFLEAPLDAIHAEEVLNLRTSQYLRDPQNVNLRRKELWLSPWMRQLAPYFVFNFGGSEFKNKKSFSEDEMPLINFLYHHAENMELRSGLEQLNFKVHYFPADTRLKRLALPKPGLAKG